MYYLYILYSKSADKYYVGQSKDPFKRLLHHNSDEKDTYTSKFRKWSIVAVFEVAETRAGALKIEQWIKRQKSRRLIEQLVNPRFMPNGYLAQLVRVPHVRD